MNTLIVVCGVGDPYKNVIMGRTDVQGASLRLCEYKIWDKIILVCFKEWECVGQKTLKVIQQKYPNVDCCLERMDCAFDDNWDSIVDSIQSVWQKACLSNQENVCIGLGEGMDSVGFIWMNIVDEHPVAQISIIKMQGEAIKVLWESARKLGVGKFELNEEEAVFLDDILDEVGIVGEHPLLSASLEKAVTLAEYSVPVLIEGEVGTEKDLFARLIHKISSRRNKKWVTMHCLTVSGELEGRLVGYQAASLEKEAICRLGKLRLADGGTLFLDDIGMMCMHMQIHLLRLLESGCIEPVGSMDSIALDVRIIATTDNSIERAVKEGTFREDLYYKLSVGRIYLPPLRERLSDLPILTEKFLKEINKCLCKQKTIAQDVLLKMMDYSWPGNIQELKNTLERAVLFSSGDELTLEDIFPYENHRYWSPREMILPELEEGFSMEKYLGNMRVKLIEKALEKSEGKQSKAARLLGVTPQAINKFLRE